jgi:hypothetical protein
MSRLQALFLLLVANVLWGSSHAIGKLAIDSFDPLILAGIRVSIATACFWGLRFSGIAPREGVPRRDILVLCSLGLLTVACAQFFDYRGLSLTTATDSSLMIIGEVFVDDPTVIELGLLVKAIDEGSSNEVVADSLSKVVAYGLKTSGPDTLNVKFRLLFIRSASKTSPPVTLNTVVFAEIPRFPVAAPAAVLERITTAEDEVFVEVMVVVPPPPQALNSIVR